MIVFPEELLEGHGLGVIGVHKAKVSKGAREANCRHSKEELLLETRFG
jgi:hypothetical protein